MDNEPRCKAECPPDIQSAEQFERLETSWLELS